MPTTTTSARAGLTGNHLKLLAALFMTIDHAGLLLVPQVVFLRVVGRLAYPIFAFMIAQGCRHTRSRVRYLLGLLILGLGCQVVYGFWSDSLYLNILLTFSLSVPVIFALQYLQTNVPPSGTKTGRLLGVLLLTVAVAGVWVLTRLVDVDYGFWGVMTPVLASIPRHTEDAAGRNHRDVLGLGLGLICLSLAYGGIQIYGLLALPLLLLYNGQRGSRKLKYFFYIFYPVHLAILEGIRMLLDAAG